MDKSNPPTRFGVFKPVGHVVIGFHSTDLPRAATQPPWVLESSLRVGRDGADRAG